MIMSNYLLDRTRSSSVGPIQDALDLIRVYSVVVNNKHFIHMSNRVQIVLSCPSMALISRLTNMPKAQSNTPHHGKALNLTAQFNIWKCKLNTIYDCILTCLGWSLREECLTVQTTNSHLAPPTSAQSLKPNQQLKVHIQYSYWLESQGSRLLPLCLWGKSVSPSRTQTHT